MKPWEKYQQMQQGSATDPQQAVQRGPWLKYSQAPTRPRGTTGGWEPTPPPPVMETITNPQQLEGPPAAPGAPGMQAMPQQMQEGVPAQRRETPLSPAEGGMNVLGAVSGAGEAAGTMATGGIAEMLAGLAGMEALLTGEGSDVAAERVRNVQQWGTYQPKTPQGQKILEGLGIPFQALAEGAGRVGEATLDATGSPLAATAVHTAIEAAPGVVGLRTGRPGRGERRRAAAEVERGAKDLGIGMNEGVTAQRQQILDAAERTAAGGRTTADGQPQIPEQGAAMPDVQAGMVAARNQARDVKNDLYAQAKQGDAAIMLDEAVGLADRMDNIRQRYLIDDMPQAKRLMGEVDQLRRIQQRRDALIAKGGAPKDIAVTINQLEEWRQKVRRNQPKEHSDSAQFSAMNEMASEADRFMDELFNADMISGDPGAIAAWRRARAANQSYRERFSDEKVIRDMVEMEAEPETVRKWIFGANAAGAKTEAANVVRRIKAELGEDSPEFAALRGEAVLDILDPILGPDPNLRGFVRRYDQFVDRRSGLAQELFGENLKGLTDLRNLAQAHRDRPVVAISELPGGARILSVAAFGHQLARKALTVRAGSTAATILGRTSTVSPKRRMMADILGYDPYAPMFGKGTAATLGATQELADPPTEENPGVSLGEGVSSGLRRRATRAERSLRGQ